jgi:hypothetical protein
MGIVAVGDAPGGDLPAAEPESEGAADRAETGSTARIILGARRQRSVEAFQRFQRAVARRDIAAIASMLDASVYSIDSGESLPREAAVAEIEALLARADPNLLAAQIAAFRPVARSAAEYRRVGRSTRVAITPDDWFVEPTQRVVGRGGMSPPVNTVMVRFVGDEPVIAGFARATTYR